MVGILDQVEIRFHVPLYKEKSVPVLVRLRDFWEMHLHWCMAWRALRERICYNSKAGGGA